MNKSDGKVERISSFWNAKAMVAAGAAVTLSESELETLGAVVSGLVASPERLMSLEQGARSMGRPDAAARVADLLAPLVKVA